MVTKKIKGFFIFALLIMLLFISTNTYGSTTSKRLSGLNRYQTSAAVSLEGWQQSDYAVLASGEDFPDALSAAPLAKKYNAPILLTQKDYLPTETINALQQLKVKNIIIVGGTGVISTSEENQINLLGIKTTRLAGKDRYETDIKVAELLDNVSEIAIVTGEDFADALSIAPIAVKDNIPIILTEHNVIPDVVKTYINTHKITKTYVIGVGSSLDGTLVSGLANVEQINGIDKYQRNLAIIDKFKSEMDLSTVYVATGEDFADALTGSVLAGKNSNPLLLLGADVSLPKKYIADNLITMSNIKILGGNSAITDDTINNLLSVSSNSVLSVTDVSKNTKAVVLVEAKDNNNKVFATGSGCIFSSDGKLITNYHVIDGAYNLDVILQDGTKYDVSGVLGYSKGKDLAILQLNGVTNLPIVQLGDSDTLQLGNQVVAIGSPQGIENTVSTGIVSGLNRVNQRDGKDIQISVPISNGSSGGGLFNMSGQVVGITYAGIGTTGDLNFAIPINDAKSLTSVVTLTQLSQLVSTTTTTSTTTSTPNNTSFFPKLSDVLMPSINYTKAETSDDGQIVSYLYSISTLKPDFINNYDTTLINDGWSLYEAGTDSSGNPFIFCYKKSNIVCIKVIDNYVSINGLIR